MATNPSEVTRQDEDDIIGALRDTLEPGETAVVLSERRLSVVADEQSEHRMRDTLGGLEPWEVIAELGKRSPGGRQGLHCSTGRRRRRKEGR